MGLSLKKLGKGLLKVAGGLLSQAINLLGSLIPLPKLPKALAQGGKSYNADFQINDAQIGDVKQSVYGSNVVVWGQECSEPYSTYDGEEETRHALLHISAGYCPVSAVRFGNTPIGSLAASQAEVLLPGIRNELFPSNVSTNPDCKDLDLKGGALSQIILTNDYDFDGSRISNRNNDTDLLSIPEGAEIVITGGANAGTYTVGDVGSLGGFPKIRGGYLDVGGTLVTETATVTITYQQENVTAQTLRTEKLSFVFDAALAQVSGPEDSLVDFRVGDEVGAYDGSSLNDGVTFTVLDSLGGSALVLGGTLTNETATCRIYLKRRRTGPYRACPPGARVNQVGLHFFFLQGLTRIKGDTFKEWGVRFETRWRPIDDAGTPLADWTSEYLNVAASTIDAWRETKYLSIDPPARVEVDLCRVSQESDDSNVRDVATWGGLIGFIENQPGDDPAVDDSATRLAVKVRSSGQLSRLAENAVNVDASRWLSVWDGESWSELQPTRNPAWICVHWLVSMSRGRITLDDLDLSSFLDFAERCDLRADTFDAVFDQIPQYLEGANAILAVGRGQLYRHPLTGLLSVWADAATAPVQMLIDGYNCTLGEEQIETPSSDSVTGVQVQWFDPLLRKERDGPVAGSEVDPEVTKVMGCTSWQKAWELAVYDYLQGRYRVHSLPADCEMEGLLVRYGDRVLVVSDAKRYGQGARVDSISGLTLSVWPPLRWVSGAQHYVYLQGRDGVPGARINCTRGSADDRVVLASAIDVPLREDGDTAPMLLAFGHDGTDSVRARGPLIALVTGGQPRAIALSDGGSIGGRGMSLQLTVDNDAVHADPGPAPADPYQLDGTVPVLAITGLVADEDSGAIELSWDALVVPDATPIYEASWRYQGELDYRVVRRGVTASAAFVVAMAGVVEYRVRGLLADRLIREATGQVLVAAGGGSLTVSASPTEVYGYGASNPISSSLTSAAITGGAPPYTLSWLPVSGASFTVVPVSNNSARFRANLPLGFIRQGYVKAHVVDSLGAVAESGEVYVELERSGSSGGLIP